MHRFLLLQLLQLLHLIQSPQTALRKNLFTLPKRNRNLESLFILATFCTGLILATPTMLHAQSFSAVVSPPRFEVTVQPGKTIRHVFEITQASNDKGNYRLYTNDWVIGADGNAVFSDKLAPNSCRPWVSIEKRELSIAGNAKIRFRFEVAAPADAVAGECRFAIMIEGAEQVVKAVGALSFPVSGRVGVVVYVGVGDAAPKLEITQNGTRVSDGVVVPVFNIKNTGNAHGRPVGFLKGKDSQGQQIDFSPEPLPVLPGQTRLVPLIPQLEAGAATKLVYPLTITGAVEWSDAPGSKRTEVDFRFEGPPAALPTTPPKETAPAPVPPSKPLEIKKQDALAPTGLKSVTTGAVPK